MRSARTPRELPFSAANRSTRPRVWQRSPTPFAPPDIARLLAATDLLIDGPYLRDRPDALRPWLGSTNQGIRALTPVYAAEVARIERDGGLDRLEIRIRPDGQIDVNGWAGDAALEQLLHDLGPRQHRPTPHRPGTKARLA